MLSTVFALMYLQMTKHPEWLTTRITGIQTFSTMYVLMYIQDYPAAWMTYYTHHRHTGTLHNRHLTVSAQYYAAWVLHYTHHWVLDNPHQVRVDTHSKYTGRREKKKVWAVKTRLNLLSHRKKTQIMQIQMLRLMSLLQLTQVDKQQHTAFHSRSPRCNVSSSSKDNLRSMACGWGRSVWMRTLKFFSSFSCLSLSKARIMWKNNLCLSLHRVLLVLW